MKRSIRYALISLAFSLAFMTASHTVSAQTQNLVYAYHSGAQNAYATFATLSAALNNGSLADNDIIELNGDIYETGQAELSKNNITIRSKEGANHTVDLSGCYLHYHSVYTISGTGLNVIDITFANYTTGQTDRYGMIFNINNNGTTTFGKQCIFKNNNGTNNANGVCVVANTAPDGQVSPYSSKVVVDGAQFIDNTAMHGAAIFLYSGSELTINGNEALFENNIVVDDGGCGGAISIRESAKVTVNAGTFTKNKGKYGGAINLRGALEVNGGNFIKNDLAIVTSNGFDSVIINGGLFEGNKGNYGPAIQFQSWGGTPGKAIINGGTFKNNVASVHGGALTVRCNNQDINLEIKGGTFEGNKAAELGGVIDIVPGAKVTLTGGTFKGNQALEKGLGNCMNQGGVLCIGGSPVIDSDQDVYLNEYSISGICTYNVITKVGELGSALNVPVTLDGTNMAGRDILVSNSGASSSSTGKVIAGDLDHFTIVNPGWSADYNTAGLSSAASAYTPADVLELSGPFLVVSTGISYPTLQQAVDAAAAEDKIVVKTGNSDYYDAVTFSTDHPETYYASDWGGEVLIKDKSLTIVPEDSENPVPLKDFVFVIAGSTTLRDITLDGLKLTGKSKIMVYPGNASEGINNLTIKNCYLDVNGGVPSVGSRTQSGTLHNNYGFPNYTNGASILFCGMPYGKINSFQFTGNTYLNHDAGRCISGRGMFESVEISGNTIGSESCRFSDHFITFEDNGFSSNEFTFRIHDNIFFSSTSMLAWFTTGGYGSSNTHDNNVFVYNNEIFRTPAGRPTVSTKSSGGLIWAAKINQVSAGSVTLTTYDNTVNGYCFNGINTDVTSHDNVVFKAQPGHSYKFTADVPSGKAKADDEVYHNVANVYNVSTGLFETYDLSTSKYCTHCDELIGPATIIIKRTGLTDKESAIYKVYKVVESSESLVGTVSLSAGEEMTGVTGLDAGTYKVVETGWNWSYVKSTVTVDKTATAGDGTATFEVEAGETVTCTFSGDKGTGKPKHGEDFKDNRF